MLVKSGSADDLLSSEECGACVTSSDSRYLQADPPRVLKGDRRGASTHYHSPQVTRPQVVTLTAHYHSPKANHYSALPNLSIQQFKELFVVLGQAEAFDHDLCGVFDFLPRECAT